MKDDLKKKNTEESQSFFREVQIEFLIHELKDPVSVAETGLRTVLERREKYGELTLRQEKTLKRVLRNIKKSREMLYSLLEIGRSQARCFDLCEFTPADVLYDILMDCLEIMEAPIAEQCAKYDNKDAVLEFLAGKGIILHIEPGMENTGINQDKTKFYRIVGNLVKNALHHRKKSIKIRMEKAGENIKIEVSDDGPGIDPKNHKMVFQRYSQVKENACSVFTRKGHGLGLAGARILARCLGGDIVLESAKDKGACFRLVLPLSAEN